MDSLNDIPRVPSSAAARIEKGIIKIPELVLFDRKRARSTRSDWSVALA